MPRKALAGPPKSTVEQLQAFLKDEYNNEAKFTHNVVRACWDADMFYLVYAVLCLQHRGVLLGKRLLLS